MLTWSGMVAGCEEVRCCLFDILRAWGSQARVLRTKHIWRVTACHCTHCYGDSEEETRGWLLQQVANRWRGVAYNFEVALTSQIFHFLFSYPGFDPGTYHRFSHPCRKSGHYIDTRGREHSTTELPDTSEKGAAVRKGNEKLKSEIAMKLKTWSISSHLFWVSPVKSPGRARPCPSAWLVIAPPTLWFIVTQCAVPPATTWCAWRWISVWYYHSIPFYNRYYIRCSLIALCLHKSPSSQLPLIYTEQIKYGATQNWLPLQGPEWLAVQSTHCPYGYLM